MENATFVSSKNFHHENEKKSALMHNDISSS